MDKPIIMTKEGDIAVMLLNRPHTYNALNFDSARVFYDLIVPLTMDNTVKGLVISGKGDNFCAGGDLDWVSRHESGPPAAFYRLAGLYHQAVLELRRMPKPVIAAINGIAAGGGFTMTLACDFRVMEKSALLRQAYTSNGLCIDGGGTFMLPRIVGLARALEIASFDNPISSEQALAWGLATKVVEDGKALEEAIQMTKDLTKKSLNSFQWSKRLLTDSFNSSIEEHLERERVGISACAAHDDGKEGIQAFLEKRKPIFKS